MATRRGVLKLVGGGVVLAVVAGGGWYAANGPSAEAREAWREAGTPEEKRRRFLSYALLAPNPHNRQPWIVKLEGEDELTLYCDLDRRLPATDPFDRQITLGCGAFLELLSIAAASEGFAAEVTPFPEGEPSPRLDQRPVAHVRLIAGGAQPDPLFGFITKRHTNRNTYDKREVAPDVLKQLEAAGGVHGLTAQTTGEGDLAGKLRDLTWRAHQMEMLTQHTLMESVDLMRIGKAEVNAHRDGLVLEGQMIEFGKLAGMVSREAIADPKSDAFKLGMDQYRDKAMSARAFAWLTGGETRGDELAAGRAYARLALKAADLNLAIHPWSQSLQEYPEMAALYDEVHALIGASQRIQMLVRVGYADPVVAAPRRGLDDLMSRKSGRLSQREDAPQLFFRLFTEINIIAQLSGSQLERVLPEGFSVAQFTVLNHFVRLGGAWAPSRLAASFQVTKGAMTNTLQRLEAQGFVKIADDPKDARAKLVEITEAGKKAREQAIRALAPVLASLSGVIAPADVKSALPFLENLRKTLDERR